MSGSNRRRYSIVFHTILDTQVYISVVINLILTRTQRCTLLLAINLSVVPTTMVVYYILLPLACLLFNLVVNTYYAFDCSSYPRPVFEYVTTVVICDSIILERYQLNQTGYYYNEYCKAVWKPRYQPVVHIQCNSKPRTFDIQWYQGDDDPTIVNNTVISGIPYELIDCAIDRVALEFASVNSCPDVDLRSDEEGIERKYSVGRTVSDKLFFHRLLPDNCRPRREDFSGPPLECISPYCMVSS